MKQFKALEILKDIRLNYQTKYILNRKIVIDEAIAELEALENRSCNGCKYLEDREELLKHSCLIEVCRNCTRSNIDNWEQKC